jgi:hypothetical protein
MKIMLKKIKVNKETYPYFLVGKKIRIIGIPIRKEIAPIVLIEDYVKDIKENTFAFQNTVERFSTYLDSCIQIQVIG